MKKFYENFSNEECILRDHLAGERTLLALERTSLAYIRTSLTALIAGMTLIKFFSEVYFQISGWLLICAGIAIAIVGIGRAHIEKVKLNKLIVTK